MSPPANPATSHSKAEGIPPRARILAAAGELFYRHGIRAVGVESIAEAAGTNKMTLYRHFDSKDELVAQYLRQEAAKGEASWAALEAQHSGDPLAQIRAWMAARYGDFILFRPRFNLRNAWLWGAPGVLLLIEHGMAAIDDLQFAGVVDRWLAITPLLRQGRQAGQHIEASQGVR